MLSQRDLGWTAGFLDGEGHFRLHRNKRGGSSVEIAAFQAGRELPDRLRALYGGTVRFRKNAGKGIHTWVVTGRTAVGLMMTLYTLMSAHRREQITKALTGWKARPGTGAHHREKTHCPKGHPYSAENTYRVFLRGKTRSRQCRACHVLWWRVNRGRYSRQRRGASPDQLSLP